MDRDLKLKPEEINLLLITLDSCAFPEEFYRHPKDRSTSIVKRTERKLKRMLKEKEQK